MLENQDVEYHDLHKGDRYSSHFTRPKGEMAGQSKDTARLEERGDVHEAWIAGKGG